MLDISAQTSDSIDQLCKRQIRTLNSLVFAEIVRMRPISERAASYLWRKYADYVWTKWERMLIWNMVEPYTRPKSFTPVVTIYIAAFYTGVVGAAITEQLYKVFLLFSVFRFCCYENVIYFYFLAI